MLELFLMTLCIGLAFVYQPAACQGLHGLSGMSGQTAVNNPAAPTGFSNGFSNGFGD